MQQLLSSDSGSGETLLTRAQRTVRTIGGICRTHYPGFLFGLPLARNEIPVFIYHDVTPSGFAQDLEFLRVNGYRTLGLDEFIARSDRSRGVARGARGRSVLLTFDDARRSFYSAALPVLREYGARATLFAPSRWMEPAEQTGADLFMTWSELRECVESGCVDVQSHSHRHALVHTSDRLVGFASPALLARYDIYDWPMRHTRDGDQLGRPAPGTPIYRAAPLLSAQSRYVESAGLTEACVQLVEEAGGADFFSRPDWALRLRRLHQARAGVLCGEYCNDERFDRLLASDFELARAAFTRHLGYAPSVLAYPWMLGSDRSLEMARRFGIRTVFGVALDYRKARAHALPVRVFGRLKADWLPLLPGKGRSSLLTVAARKIGAFSRIQHLAH